MSDILKKRLLADRERAELKERFPEEIYDKIIDADDMGGIDLRDLNVGDVVEIQTTNSSYTLKITEKKSEFCEVAEALGGFFGDKPRRVIILGCNYGGSLLRTHWIGLLMKLEMMLNAKAVVTTSTIWNIKVKRSA